MEISVTSTIAQVLPQLEQFTSRQAPFTIAKALTATAQQVRDEFRNQTPVAFDRPNAFTRQAWAMQKADKRELTAFVFAKDKQARYLKFGVQGGGRRIKGFEKKFDSMGEHGPNDALVPTRNIKLDNTGGVSLATIKRMSQNMNTKGTAGRYFIGKPKGGGQNAGRGWGIYARVGNNKRIEALMVFASKPQYKRRFDMTAIGGRVVNQQFVAQLQQAWAYAMRTAK
jgi:hypothetical protein